MCTLRIQRAKVVIYLQLQFTIYNYCKKDVFFGKILVNIFVF